MPTTFEMITRLLLSALLGSLVGFERERLFWVAGLRTHMLVSVGASLFMLVSAFGFSGALGPENVELDVSRVASQVVSGIGFLGAGTILLRHDIIRGLTTAASLWTVAAIGLAVGGGLYVPAIAATALVLIILAAMKPIENMLHARRGVARNLFIEIDPTQTSDVAIQAAVSYGKVEIRHIETTSDSNHSRQYLRFIAFSNTPNDLEQLLTIIRALKGVENVNLD